KLKLIEDKNLVKISAQTRDSKIAVYKDKISDLVFLKDIKISKKYYIKKKKTEKILVKKNKIIQEKSITKINNNKIITQNLSDDLRRYFQFKKNIKNKKVLDFGCGWGGFLNEIKNSNKIYGLEIRDECYDYIKSNMKKIKIFKNLKQINEKFDLITMFHVLEHLPNQIEVLKNLKKRLKKNGKLIIEVPHSRDILLNLDNLKEFKNFTLWSEHLILHTEKSLRKFLSISGYKNIKIYYFQRYGFDNHLHWFVNKKPGGHELFKKYNDKSLNLSYKKYLIKNKITDTIFAEANI
ncbi:class I SAM-dependent methyltransferase, partial [Candidatus Pelagibacter sp. HIMB1782]|uniref:class I SAM-dependent methyltransferase n=1 Tax=Candidatus Pelagibacter sp. HIMB1782 TaxID=3413375 RepID=UPI003F85650D